MNWQPIATAPDEVDVLGFVGPIYAGGVLILSYHKTNGLWGWRDWDQDIWDPTHWMPLPEAPEQDDRRRASAFYVTEKSLEYADVWSKLKRFLEIPPATATHVSKEVEYDNEKGRIEFVLRWEEEDG